MRICIILQHFKLGSFKYIFSQWITFKALELDIK